MGCRRGTEMSLRAREQVGLVGTGRVRAAACVRVIQVKREVDTGRRDNASSASSGICATIRQARPGATIHQAPYWGLARARGMGDCVQRVCGHRQWAHRETIKGR